MKNIFHKGAFNGFALHEKRETITLNDVNHSSQTIVQYCVEWREFQQ
jgi:histone H3/H4